MADEKKDKKKKKKSKKSKVDFPTIIFFSLLIIGAVVLTIIAMKKPNSKLYSKIYGDNIETLVEVYDNNEVDIAVSVDGDRTLQQGKYTIVGEKSKDSYDGEYDVVFTENGKEIEVKMVIKEDKMTLTYEDGTTIEFKERQ